MNEDRALFLISDIVDAVLRRVKDPLEAVKVLEDYGFEPEELVEDFDIPVEYVPNYKTEEEREAELREIDIEMEKIMNEMCKKYGISIDNED